MKKLLAGLIILSALPYDSWSQKISKEDIINAGIAKYKTLSQEEIDYLVKNKSSQEVINAIKTWEEFSKNKLSKSAYAEIMAEYNVSVLSLSKYAVQKNKNMDEAAIRSMGYYVLQNYLNDVMEKDTVNEMVCFWTWELPFEGFFESRYHRFHPERKSTRMNSYGPVIANVYGGVHIECNMPEAEIYMDKVAQNLFTDLKIVVPVGTREFQITKQGYTPCKEKIIVKRGKVARWKCELAKPERDSCHVFDKLKAILINKLGVDPREVTKEASLTNDLGADELDTVEIILEVEKQFKITINDEDAERISTVGQYTSYLIGRVCK
jgi:acyl carrier protein